MAWLQAWHSEQNQDILVNLDHVVSMTWATGELRIETNSAAEPTLVFLRDEILGVIRSTDGVEVRLNAWLQP